jgi:hypothetical protein
MLLNALNRRYLYVLQLVTEKFWGSAFADDLTVFAKDNDELRKVLVL